MEIDLDRSGPDEVFSVTFDYEFAAEEVPGGGVAIGVDRAAVDAGAGKGYDMFSGVSAVADGTGESCNAAVYSCKGL